LNSILIFISLFFGVGIVHVWAARPGVVNVDEIEVRESPSDRAKVLETLHRGDVVQASNHSVSGYYKSRTQSGIIGWISKEGVHLEDPISTDTFFGEYHFPDDFPSPQKTLRKIEKGNARFRRTVQLRGFAGINLFSAGSVIPNYVLTQGFEYGGELEISVTPKLDFVIRTEKIFKGYLLTDGLSSRDFRVDISSQPVMIGVQGKLYRASRFLLEASLLGGLGLNTGIQSTVSSATVPSTTTASFSGHNLTFLGKIDVSWQFSRRFGTFFETGYRYLNSSAFDPPRSTGSGADILEPGFSLNLSGLMLAMGLTFSL
jgi:hypothetical protein